LSLDVFRKQLIERRTGLIYLAMGPCLMLLPLSDLRLPWLEGLRALLVSAGLSGAMRWTVYWHCLGSFLLVLLCPGAKKPAGDLPCVPTKKYVSLTICSANDNEKLGMTR
jgi:hypothetical protein